jgi:hypothetical protein
METPWPTEFYAPSSFSAEAVKGGLVAILSLARLKAAMSPSPGACALRGNELPMNGSTAYLVEILSVQASIFLLGAPSTVLGAKRFKAETRAAAGKIIGKSNAIQHGTHRCATPTAEPDRPQPIDPILRFPCLTPYPELCRNWFQSDGTSARLS